MNITKDYKPKINNFKNLITYLKIIDNEDSKYVFMLIFLLENILLDTNFSSTQYDCIKLAFLRVFV